MSVPAISVIMPCFNAERHIGRGAASALGQTYGDIELIVVDDGSTDGSAAVLERLQDPRLVAVRQEHRGVSAARNAGLTRAVGRYIAFLDADDTWDSRFLEKMVRALETAPRAVLAYCGWQNVGLSGGMGKPHIPPEREGERKIESLLAGCPWPIHAALTRREAVAAAGGFDERVAIAEDYGLWLRVAAFNPIVRVPEVLAYYNFHGGAQATKNRAKALRHQWLAQQQFLKEHLEIVLKLGESRVRELTTGSLLRHGYDLYWHRDLHWAQEIFRMVIRTGHWQFRDLRYLLPALMPFVLYQRLVGWMDSRAAKKNANPIHGQQPAEANGSCHHEGLHGDPASKLNE